MRRKTGPTGGLGGCSEEGSERAEKVGGGEQTSVAPRPTRTTNRPEIAICMRMVTAAWNWKPPPLPPPPVQLLSLKTGGTFPRSPLLFYGSSFGSFYPMQGAADGLLFTGSLARFVCLPAACRTRGWPPKTLLPRLVSPFPFNNLRNHYFDLNPSSGSKASGVAPSNHQFETD